MDKPIKPSKKVEARGARTFYFDHVSKKVSVLTFLDWLREELPDGAYDATLSIEEDVNEENGDILSCNILLEWKFLTLNTRYKSETKKYEKQLAKWKKQCQK